MIDFNHMWKYRAALQHGIRAYFIEKKDFLPSEPGSYPETAVFFNQTDILNFSFFILQ